MERFQAVVLCGPPGAGKSSEIWRRGGELAEKDPNALILQVDGLALQGSTNFRQELLETTTWKEARKEKRQRILIVDGFDQLRIPGGLPFQKLALALKDEDPAQLRLVLGCRAGDWDATLGEPLLSH